MKSETNPKTVMLKDYIIDMDSVSAKVTIDYEVVLENNTDFIVKRRTLKTDRELVVLVSKGIFYIKDCKTDHVDQLTETNLSSFLRDLKERCITLHQVHWLHTVFRESVDFIMNVITDEKLMDMCRHNVLVSTHYPHWYVPFWEQNSKLFMRLYNMFPNMSDRKKYQPSIPVIFWIERHHGANEAMYFAEKLVQSGITELNFSSHYTNYYDNNAISSKEIVSFKAIMESPYNINLRRFIDYILFDLYAQGYSSVERTFFQRVYGLSADAAGLLRESQGEIPGAFQNRARYYGPESQSGETDRYMRKLSEQSEAIKDLAYTGSKYSIVIPTKPEELAEEGINLSHCVGQYIDRVAKW